MVIVIEIPCRASRSQREEQAGDKIESRTVHGALIGGSFSQAKIELPSVLLLSEKESTSIPSECRMLRYMFDIGVSPLGQ